MRASVVGAMLAAMVAAVQSQGRPEPARASDALLAASDLVVVARLVGTRGTGRRAPHPARPDLTANELESLFEVLSVVKGGDAAPAVGARITMRHFRVDVNKWREDHPGATVPRELYTVGRPVEFLARDRRYQLFLTRAPGTWEPASGQAQPGPSVVADEDPTLPPRAMTRRGSASRSATEPISPVAWATWLMRGEQPTAFDVIVIWRGAPGWFAVTSGRRRSSGSSERSFASTETFGDIRLEFELEFATRTATVQGHRVALGDANLILVDGVNEPGGGRVTETRRLAMSTLEWQQERPVVQSVLRQHADLVAFLRCDVPVPGGRAQGSIDVLCARLTGR
jgi:hypothetical protein